MTGPNMPTKFLLNRLVLRNSNPSYTVNVALVQAILTKNYGMLINTLYSI
jgi:hypothetical protein